MSDEVISCCQRYLLGGLDLLVEWSDLTARTEGTITADDYRSSVRWLAPILAGILRGEPCPWHENGPDENYLSIMAAMGGSDGIVTPHLVGRP